MATRGSILFLRLDYKSLASSLHQRNKVKMNFFSLAFDCNTYLKKRR